MDSGCGTAQNVSTQIWSGNQHGKYSVPRVVYMVEFDDFMSQLEQSSTSDPSSKPVQQVRHNIIPGPRIPRPMNHLSGQRPDKPNPITSSCKTARRRPSSLLPPSPLTAQTRHRTNPSSPFGSKIGIPTFRGRAEHGCRGRIRGSLSRRTLGPCLSLSSIHTTLHPSSRSFSSLPTRPPLSGVQGVGTWDVAIGISRL